jgi:hypothetical protein
VEGVDAEDIGHSDLAAQSAIWRPKGQPSHIDLGGGFRSSS